MTELLYLSDTYLFEALGIVEEISENEHGSYIILDRTIFYPQWGGQPSDIGTILSESWIFEVKKVRLDEHGWVYHFGNMLSGNMTPWETVDLKIDTATRIQNAKNHSAGHLIDIAISNIGLDWEAKKWYHFPEWSYVEYSGDLNQEENILIETLNSELSKLIEKNIKVNISEPNISILTPHGKKARHVAYDGTLGCGCGGTHVRSSLEIGSIVIRKIKMKDGMIRVSYSV